MRKRERKPGGHLDIADGPGVEEGHLLGQGVPEQLTPHPEDEVTGEERVRVRTG